MAYVQTHTPFTQEGEHTGPDNVPRTVVNLGGVRIDEADARRLAQHFHERDEDGSLPLAAQCRELAIPIMEALVAAGYHLPE